MNNECLAVSFIWEDRPAQSFGYILISILLNPLKKTQSFSWNNSLSLRVIWNDLLKDIYCLPLVKSCLPLLRVGAIGISNPRPQLVTGATHFAWIGLLFLKMGLWRNIKNNITPPIPYKREVIEWQLSYD